MTSNIIDSVIPLDRPTDEIDEHVKLFDSKMAEDRGENITPSRLRRAADYLNAFADEYELQQEDEADGNQTTE